MRRPTEQGKEQLSAHSTSAGERVREHAPDNQSAAEFTAALASLRGARQPPVVVVSGMDGSGKTTIIAALQKLLHSHGIETRTVWLRYNHYLTRFLFAFCRLTGFTKWESRDPPICYHEFHKSRLISAFYIGLSFIDTAVASVVAVHVPRMFGGRMTIVDRWIIDILVDLETETGVCLPNGHRIYRLFAALRPADAITVILGRDEDATMTSRAANRLDRTFAQRYALYRRHVRAPDVHLIANDADPETVARRILAVAARVETKLDGEALALTRPAELPEQAEEFRH